MSENHEQSLQMFYSEQQLKMQRDSVYWKYPEYLQITEKTIIRLTLTSVQDLNV